MPSRKILFLLAGAAAACVPLPAVADMTFTRAQIAGAWLSYYWPALVSLACMALYFVILPGTPRRKALPIGAAAVTFLLFRYLGNRLIGEYAIASSGLMPALVLLLLSAWYGPGGRQPARGVGKTVLRLATALALYLLALAALVLLGGGYSLMIVIVLWPAALAALVFAQYLALAPVARSHKAVMGALFVACGGAAAIAAFSYYENYPDTAYPMALAPTLAVLLYHAAYQRKHGYPASKAVLP